MSIAAILAIIAPILAPLLANLFSGCKTPASGQNEDPRAELLAQKLPNGKWNPVAIRRAVPEFKRAARRNNRRLHRHDPKRVDIAGTDWTKAVEKHFDELLAVPAPALKVRYQVGLSDYVNDEGDA